jgi:2-methylisocitrate lyase-like PEP mutase family enzyme
MRTQVEKANLFKALHKQDGAFIIPNPWDVATARLLEHLGFQALATTSAGYAFSRGQQDNTVSRDEMMSHLSDITSATHLPISADLGNCFGDDPSTVAETIRLAAAAGIVGCSVEDSGNRQPDPIYEFELAVERVRAAVDAARALPFPFTLTARAENYFVGRADIKDTIHRLQAYREAGADVVFAHGMRNRDDIAAMVRSVDCPVNVMMGLKGVQLDLEELSHMGVKRVSVGPSLFMAAMSVVFRAGREMQERGTFTFANESENLSDLINAMIRP